MQNTKNSGKLPFSETVNLSELLDYATGSIVSRTIHKTKAGTMTVFAFDKGQELSEHSAPFDAYVQILHGEAKLLIDGKPVNAHAGDTVVMPANIPHAVIAEEQFKMLLTMIKE